jgi:Arylsulfotransferase (ASST)
VIAPAISRIEKEQANYGGPTAARCLPERLNVSAVLPGSDLAVSPLPDSRDASPHAQISLLGVPSHDISDVNVAGSFTGGHAGHLIPYSQGDGASFVPDHAFAPGESVQVEGRVKAGSTSRRFAYRFTVAYPDRIAAERPGSKLAMSAGEYQSFRSAPQLHPPRVDVTHSSPQADGSGDIFAAPYTGPGQTGPMIFEPDGQLVWMDPLPEHVAASNLEVQRLGGEPVLTWWQGYIPQNGFGMGEEIVANTAYQPIMHVHAGNGQEADLHVFRLQVDNTALLTVFDTIHCDLTSVGGPRDGDLTDSLFQELDLKTGLVRREWTSADHVPLSASYASATQASAEWPYDYFHLNTVDPRADGTILLSARNTSQLYLISGKTGRVEATIGGRDSSVRMEPGTETAYQHNAQTLPNGEISIFDNGGSPFAADSHSRALIVQLNLKAGTDTKVAEFVRPQPLQSPSQGSVQLLPDGDWFVGWGGEPYFSEFSPSGTMIYDAHMPLVVPDTSEHTTSYRGYQLPWHGGPTSAPAIAVESRAGGATVYASWNGATDVSAWRVLGGSSRRALTPISRGAKSGFETAISVRAESYLQVEALDAAGAVIGRSATVRG